MTNSADPDQLASIYTVCNGRVYPGSAGLGLKAVYPFCCNCPKIWYTNFSAKMAHAFVCVEVLQPSQPNGVMWSVVS